MTARGNRREPIFFEDGDQEIYCDILAEQMRKAAVEAWAYGLLPNPGHLILCPAREDGLALGARRSARRTGDGRTSSMRGGAGAVTCSTAGSPRWRWMKPI